MGNPFALGGVVGDGKRPEDADKVLNKIEHYPEFDVRRRERVFLVHNMCAARCYPFSQSDTHPPPIIVRIQIITPRSSLLCGDPTPRAGLGL